MSFHVWWNIERFPTSRICTTVGLNSHMDILVGGQATGPGKALPARFAFITLSVIIRLSRLVTFLRPATRFNVNVRRPLDQPLWPWAGARCIIVSTGCIGISNTDETFTWRTKVVKFIMILLLTRSGHGSFARSTTMGRWILTSLCRNNWWMLGWRIWGIWSMIGPMPWRDSLVSTTSTLMISNYLLAYYL